MDDCASVTYQAGMMPEQLAQNVLQTCFNDEMPSIPVDPFSVMRKFGIIYQFMGFAGLEGIYLVPQDKEDVPFVGINYKRKITRQRFTAAHELCHHIKDRKNEACPIGSNGEMEKYAECFAAELLMPKDIFSTVISEYIKDGKVTLDDALQIAERFGVSFRSCVLRLAYTFRVLDGDYDNLNSRIEKYKPDRKKQQLGMDIEKLELLKQAVDSYVFYFQIKEDIVWYRFKNDFIYNENRMEGLNLDEDEVAEIITDLRMKREESSYCKEQYEDIIQVAGHSALYDYVLSTKETLTIYKLLDLNRLLFCYAPFPEESGKTRTDNNLVLGTKLETVDWREVATELIKLQESVERLRDNALEMPVSEYIEEMMKIHHRITQIHPFRDGNGRSSRAMMNWMLRLKGLPPVYIKAVNKDDYYEALGIADSKQNYNELVRVIIRELFRTIIRMNS